MGGLGIDINVFGNIKHCYFVKNTPFLHETFLFP